MDDHVLDWHPDGKRVLFTSSRESGRQRFDQFYLVASTGGMPEKLPVPYGEFASFSPDGQEVAYVPQTQSNRTWKRYRGGWAPDLWRFNLQTFAAANITKNVPTMNSRCGTGTRSISCPIAAATSARTSGRST